LTLLILVAREGFLKDKCGPRDKKFEHHWSKVSSTSLGFLGFGYNCHTIILTFTLITV